MAVDVDDRELGARHLVLRHHQRRSRLVIHDRRRRDLRLPAGAGTGTKLSRRALGWRRLLRRWRLCRRGLRWRLLRGSDRESDHEQPEDGQDVPAHVRSVLRKESRIKKGPPQRTVSRILSAVARRLAAASYGVTIIPLAPPLLAGSSSLPGSSSNGPFDSPPRFRAARLTPLFGLAPCGVLPATDVATGAVRSYRTFSPLPAFALSGYGAAVYFLCHFPSSCPDRALPGALPCGVRTFLPPKRRSARGGRSSGPLRRMNLLSTHRSPG